MNETVQKTALKMYCFSYAGGSTVVFKSWRKILPPWVEVCGVELPGRGLRSQEAPVGDYRTLIDQLARELVAEFQTSRQHNPELQYVIYGHSAGARFGVAVAVEMERALGLAPLRCFLSGTTAPHSALRERRRAHLSDAEWMVELRSLGGTPPEILAEPALMEFVLPILRADFSASEGSCVDTDIMLSCPFTLIAADKDAEAPIAEVWEWERYTRAGARRVLLDGDHFSILRDPRVLLQEIRMDLPNVNAGRLQKV